jgi:predicted transcriptional regulator of viral defense system
MLFFDYVYDFQQSKIRQRLAKMIETIRRKIPQEEFDYQTLLDCLKDYSRPRDKISDLLRKGNIIRVKKGLYIFGDEYRHSTYSREILANLIYGPSYISLDYALQYHGLIPERVEAVTSVTTGRSRKFTTPVGLFTYRMIPIEAFRIGMDLIAIDENRSFLMATPEKALADKLHAGRGTGIQTLKGLSGYLAENLRIDPAVLHELKPRYIDAIARRYRSRKIRLLSDLIRRIRHNTERENLHA